MQRLGKLAYIMPLDLRSRYAHVVNVLHMCQAFKNAGREVILIAPRLGNFVDPTATLDRFGILNDFSIKFVSIPVPSVGRVDVSRNLFCIWAAFSTLRTRVDLCYTRVPLVAYMSGCLGLATVLEMHMPPASLLDTWAFTQIVNRIEKGKEQRYKVVAISQRLAEILNRRYSLPNSKVLVSHDAVDLLPYNKPESDGNSLKHQLGITDRTFLFTYSGSLYAGRGVEMIAELAQRFPQAYFLIVGGDESRIKAYQKDLQWIENLCFYGYVPHKDVARILIGSDILLLPHARRVTVDGTGDIGAYASPMKLFEYLAAAKPIIASEHPSILEILKHGENALIAEPESIESWSACVSTLLDDAELRRRLGLAAYTTAENNTWDKRAAGILEFILR